MQSTPKGRRGTEEEKSVAHLRRGTASMDQSKLRTEGWRRSQKLSSGRKTNVCVRVSHDALSAAGLSAGANSGGREPITCPKKKQKNQMNSIRFQKKNQVATTSSSSSSSSVGWRICFVFFHKRKGKLKTTNATHLPQQPGRRHRKKTR